MLKKNLIAKNRKSSEIDLKEITSPEVMEQCKVIPALVQLEKNTNANNENAW